MAVVKARPGCRNEVLTALENMVGKTREEAACMQYDLHEDLTDENTFVFYEIWKDTGGLNRHNEQPYINEFKILMDKGCVTETRMYKTKKI